MRRFGRALALASQLGVTMGLTAAGLVVLGLWLGRRIDARFGTEPIATMAFLIAGAVAGQVALYRLAVRASNYLSEDDGKAKDGQEEASASMLLATQALGVVALPGIGGFVLGLWLDKQLGTSFVATLGLTLGGLVLGLIGAWQLVRKRLKGSDE